MTPHDLMAGPGFPRLALASAWLCSLAAVGVPARLADPAARWALQGIIAVGLAATAAVVSNKLRIVTLTFSALASAAFVVGGAVAAALALLAFDTPTALVGTVAAAGGLLTGRLTRRARRMSD